MKIVADDKIPYLKGVLESCATVEYYPGKEITSAIVKDADALIVRTRTKCNADLLEGSKVKFIATATIGFDHIDTAYCASKGIAWANAPGCNSGSVMQYIASTLAFFSEKYRFNYSDKTLGIIGAGNVGSKVARYAKLAGLNVLLNDPPRERAEKDKNKFVSLREIQEKADIITFHVPLNKKGEDKTYHLADETFFKHLRPNTILINSSRGEVVSTTALKQALKENKIKAAVLDVWENEPFIDKELLKMTVAGTPHIAGYSVEGKATGTVMSVQAVSRFFNLGITFNLNDIIPPPDNRIEIECKEKNSQSIINEAVLKTCDITIDSDLLKKFPAAFEFQRENYRERHEFGAYKVNLYNNPHNIARLLSQTGFKM